MKDTLHLDQVRHMAELSRLDISVEEEKIFTEQFSRILKHMDLLQGVNTEGIEPMYNISNQHPEERKDAAENRRTPEEILSNAPETDGKYFIVPKII